ncbi:TlyA family RNA methyltransferase [Acuticoccus mangrovi]|uniref:TlyA family RNA methyltransferase n=1 Tax=Acuticoccus mangrovi TaxID=2796142 RepID=A0A934MEY8_9HYPH|nr:TlyA family RNA methyltransferase [Acuticoccus mangrovi]MBJ3774898.1 TlyA family RNA methyltransferase [Acuticoccus mangrovi]
MRLDHYLVAEGLCRSRSQAKEAIQRGAVTVNGVPARSAGQRVAPDAEVIAEATRFVGRGAHKLIAALDHFAIDPAGRDAIDIGASTGGFTEVLLERGAARVIALDVGRDQLAPSLAADPRVIVMEGVNARHLGAGDLPFAPSLMVMDVSFISLTLVLPTTLPLLAAPADVVALVKPQFEVGKAHVGKGGVVRDAAATEAALARVAATFAVAGYRAAPPIPSPFTGSDGNTEYLMAARCPMAAQA